MFCQASAGASISSLVSVRDGVNSLALGESRLDLNEQEIQEMLQSRGNNDLLRERTGNNLLLVAHRGLGPTSVFGSTFPKELPPENSISSIRAAIMQGADAIEIDIFKAADGTVVVTHDDEIWRNEYEADRTGAQLPFGETKDSYLVGKKTIDQLREVSIGRDGEVMPTFLEVAELVNNANDVLAKYEQRPILLNVEIKDSTVISEILDLVCEGVRQTDKFPLGNIIFCSFKHDALKDLKVEAERRGMLDVNIAPGIKTTELFGKENVNKDFSLKQADATYPEWAMDSLRALVEGNGFQGYDGVLWDLREPIVDLAVVGNKVIHASTSDFRQYNDDRDFALLLLELSERVTTFFKCDNVDDARKVLLESSLLLNGVGIQMMYKQAAEGEDCFYFYKSRGWQDNSEILTLGAGKAKPYSQLRSY